jgi:hypothetical protein
MIETFVEYEEQTAQTIVGNAAGHTDSNARASATTAATTATTHCVHLNKPRTAIITNTEA